GLRSLGGQEVPPGGLVALLPVELHAVGQRALNVGGLEWRALARDAGEHLAALGNGGDGAGQHLAQLAPRDEILARVAERIALAEASLGVVARSLGDASRAKRLGGGAHRARVLLARTPGVECEQRGQAGLPRA